MRCLRLSVSLVFTFLVALLLTTPFLSVQAQPSGARGDDFIYRVVKDDTLIHLAQRYTHNEQNWRRLQALNNIAEPGKMPIGTTLRIPFALIPEQAAQATIAHIRGQARINGLTARAGQAVHEGDVLETGPNSFLTLVLPDGGESSMPGTTSLQLQRLRTFTGTGLIDAIIELESGSVEASVDPGGQGTGRYEIRTPISITGVRGTQLRVRLDQQEHIYNEVLAGAAQVGNQAADGPQLMASQGTVIDPSGSIQPARPLLPAPRVADALEGNLLHFEPVNHAVGYQVRTAADPLGTRPFSIQTIEQAPASVSRPGASIWYVLVRAIDKDGLMGPDAVLELEGGPVLTSGYGLVVQDGSGQAVQLMVY